jgi:putative CocE/NonD family hydrolase
MIVDSGGFSNAYQGGIRFGGALELKQVTWAYRHALRSRAAAADPQARKALEAVDIAGWFRRMPWKRGHSPLRAVPDYEDYLFEQWERTTFDDYWTVPALYGAGYHDQMPVIPSVHITGWYDPYAITAVENFTSLKARGHPAQLILGPWTHGNRSRTHAGEVDFGPQATFDGAIAEDFVRWRIDWFRRTLLSEALPDEPPVRIFVMGGGSGRRTADGRLDHGGHWMSCTAWPPETARPLALYLHPKGQLGPEAAPKASCDRYVFDPANPVPTIGGPITSGAPVMVGGAFDQVERDGFFGCAPPFLPIASRPDVLVYETPPLEHDVTVAGDVSVVLHVSSDRPTTDFTAKLVDVHPPTPDDPAGFAMNLCDGILRACYRNSFDRAEPLTPGVVTELVVRLYPTANRFARGHRIRLEVASSNFPRFDVNPNDAPGHDLSPVRHRAVNAVHIGPDHPSRLCLWQV